MSVSGGGGEAYELTHIFPLMAVSRVVNFWTEDIGRGLAGVNTERIRDTTKLDLKSMYFDGSES